ncbi:hypothetical protein JCGZ_19093 [Jatropha curcas]|uniref:Telomeric single stranded DNA binding POT1/Cdc13 domain-containing protein n=1 Tax=Jatropha curcas TaxID=180498 RepID=A0A067JYX1_JATCU|nr:protection of telomeres protein 1a isoform X2 [Jatropha curcas]KDP28013.1 hypothetical protein JCGZ_19093 [Jatropha curcas]
MDGSRINRSRSSRNIVPISEVVQHVDQKINLVGMVVEFSFPRRSKGTDCVLILKLVDKSQQSPELSVNIFTLRMENLPVVKSYGDLIVLHSVTAKEHDGEVNIVFKKRSSFALYDGRSTDDFSCYQALGSFSLSWSERDCITNLRNWWPNAQLNSGRSEYLISMKDIVADTYFDLVCKVLHISYDISKGQWMFFVWDGMDAPFLSFDGNLVNEEKNPLPLQVESSPLDIDIVRKFFRIGTVLRVLADPSHENIGLQFHGVGKWVRIRNMAAKIFAGMWYGVLNPLSRVRFLTDDDVSVLDCRRKYKERILEFDRLPLWGPAHDLTVIDYHQPEKIQFLTLMDVICHKEDNAIFFCVVRVVAIHHFQCKDFCSLDEIGKHEMRLTLEDSTARIHAFLLEEEQVNFFNGFHSDVLADKIKRLLGVPEHQNLLDEGKFTRHPPLVKCVLDSIKDNTGNIIYYICCTKLT